MNVLFFYCSLFFRSHFELSVAFTRRLRDTAECLELFHSQMVLVVGVKGEEVGAERAAEEMGGVRWRGGGPLGSGLTESRETNGGTG